MLDPALIEADPEAVRRNCEVRGADIDVDLVVALLRDRRERTTRIGALREAANAAAKTKGAPTEEQREEARARRDEIRTEETALDELQARVDELLLRMPNLLDPRVPIGDEDDQVVVKEWGDPSRDASVPSHDEVGARLGLIDFEGAHKVAGARFYTLKGDAVRLRYALIQLFLDLVDGQGFELVAPPVLAKRSTFVASGFLPFAGDDTFQVGDRDLALIGTSEQPLISMHEDEVLDHLPLNYLGDSLCFRTEAGSHGRDVRGMIRAHQFYKLEQIVYCVPDEVEEHHLRCLRNEELLLETLGLPYRTVLTASSDLAAAGSIKYDTEVWLPSQQRYREVTSNTNLRDFQARRGRIRFKLADGRRGHPYTISATAFTDRLIVAIIENCFDGTDVRVPEALRPHLGGREILGP